MEEKLEIRENLESGLSMPFLELREIKATKRPIERAIYKKSLEDNEIEAKKKQWSDRIKCHICGVEYTRHSQSRHRKTRKHLIYMDMHKKMMKLTLEL